MKSFLLGLLLFLSAPAVASDWLFIEADHFNGLYSEGESASFTVQALSRPESPGFQLHVTVERVSGGETAQLVLSDGVAVYKTDPLSSGLVSYRFTSRLVAVPPMQPMDEIVGEQTVTLQVGQSFIGDEQ